MPRLGFTKSRNGCRKCRQRRVKCDEQRPCGACKRHGIICSLVESSTSPSSDASQPPSTVGAGSADSSSHEPLAPFPTPGPTFQDDILTGSFGVTVDPFQELGLLPSTEFHPEADSQNLDWATDVELMHHYATRAYLTMPRADEVGHVWQIEVVEHAILSKYLLHLVLAYSAFHLAHLRPQQQHRYCYIAAQHQNLGVRDVRAALGVLSADNCHALFMAGSFLAIGKFAALAIYATDKTDHRPNIEDIVEVFVLLKGMHTILQSAEDIIQIGPFNRLFAPSSSSSGPFPFWRDISERLQHLRVLFGDKLVDDPSMAALVDNEIFNLIATCEDALNFSSNPELRFIMLWPINLSNEFIQMLRQRHPLALVVLSHYCVVVHVTESKTWFTRGWASKLLEAVHATISPEWIEMIQWPLDRIQNHSL